MNQVWMVSTYDDHGSHHRVAKSEAVRDQYFLEGRRQGLRTLVEIWDPVRHAGEVVWCPAV
jgi:hypothetical protein